jgi:hypothetical protein
MTSGMSLETCWAFNKLWNNKLYYKAASRWYSWLPIWTYGIPLWGIASSCNIDILERFQIKVHRIITDAPWYVPNAVIKHDLQVSSVRQEVRTYSVTYHARLGRSSHRSSYIITSTTTSQSQTEAVQPRGPSYSFLTHPLRTPQQPQSINCDCA